MPILPHNNFMRSPKFMFTAPKLNTKSSDLIPSNLKSLIFSLMLIKDKGILLMAQL